MRSERSLRTAALVLAALGIGISAYLAIVHSQDAAPVCVAGGSGCETVAESEYSELVGIDVAVLGVAGYVVLALAALQPGDPGRFVGLLGSVAGFGFSLYLTYIELFVIDAICQWCVASAVVMTALLVVNFMRSRYLGQSPRATTEATGEPPV